MRLPFKKPPESIGAQHLQKPDKHIPVILAHETNPVDLLVEDALYDIHIAFEQSVFPLARKLGLGLPEYGGDVVLQSPLHAALEIDKIDMIVSQHDIPALKIPEHKILVIDMREIRAQRFEIV